MTEDVIKLYDILTKKDVQMKSFLMSFVTNSFQPNNTIYSMMTMTIIFLVLLLKMSFRIPKYWKITLCLILNKLTVI